jgi:hypothetical protein
MSNARNKRRLAECIGRGGEANALRHDQGMRSVRATNAKPSTPTCGKHAPAALLSALVCRSSKHQTVSQRPRVRGVHAAHEPRPVCWCGVFVRVSVCVCVCVCVSVCECVRARALVRHITSVLTKLGPAESRASSSRAARPRAVFSSPAAKVNAHPLNTASDHVATSCANKY